MQFPQLLDHGSFKAFWFAARHLNFSAAAEASSMTQSGVSQHIQKLEKELGKALFVRTSRSMSLTPEGKRFLNFLENYIDLDNALRSDIAGMEHSLSGEVRYAMPLGCLMSPHFAQLLKIKETEFPDISLKVKILSNQDITKAIAANQVDFGFLTERIDDMALELLPFCKEDYVLVGSKAYLKALKSKKATNVSVITYPGFETARMVWESSNKRSALKLNVQVGGDISDLRGVITMLNAGVGLSIIPRHCIEKELKQDLQVFPETKAAPNQIYLAQLKEHTHPNRVKVVKDAFFQL